MSADEQKGTQTKKSWLKTFWNDNQKAISGALMIPVIGILTLLGTMVKDAISDQVQPTEATITGKVMQQGHSMPGAAVVLKNNKGKASYESETDSAGEFIFIKVDDGLYRLEVSTNNVLLFSRHVNVNDNADEIPVEPIDVAGVALIQSDAPPVPPTLVPTATIAPTGAAQLAPTTVAFGTPDAGDSLPEDTPEPDETWLNIGDRFRVLDGDTVAPFLPQIAPTLAPAETYGDQAVPTPAPQPLEATPGAVTLDLTYQATPIEVPEGEAARWTIRVGLTTMRNVASVTYYLNPAFQPSVVTRFPETGFVLEVESWGSFQLGAVVQLADGTSTWLTIPITLIDA